MTLPRLPATYGSRIHRDKPIEIQFDGKTIRGFQGDNVASALIANDQWLISRSFKYHRPRGPLTLAGHDANTLVQTPEAPNRLAEDLALEHHPVVTAQNVTGSLRRDYSRALDTLGRFLPVGFYYKAFYKPRGSWALWEPVIRQSAGLGVANLQNQPGYTDKQYLFTDIAVIGAGPAGLQAALTAADSGASVLLIDENPELGGSLNYHRFDLTGNGAASLRDTLVTAVNAHPNIRVMTQALCNGWFTDHFLAVLQGSRLYKVRASSTILATGSSEQHVVFRNNDLPGVVMCSALERLLRLYGVAPRGPLVVLAGNDAAYHTAIDAHDAGMTVSCLVDMRASPNDPELEAALAQRGIALETNATVYEARADDSGLQLGRVAIHSLDTASNPQPISAKTSTVGALRRRLHCSVLAMSAGYMPAYQLACQSGAQLRYCEQSAHFQLCSLPAGMVVAGSANSVFTLEAVCADGRNAAQAALAHIGRRSEEPKEPVVCTAQVNHPWPLFPHPKGREFVDFDEDLQIKDIVNSTRQGYRDIQLVKRFSTVGMGPSQGRHSALPTARLVAKATGRSIDETGVTTARPPLKPEPLGLLAGRRFDPYRRTPLDSRHIELGAQMMPAGTWRRPAYYRHEAHDHEEHVRTAQRDAAVAAEVRAVRHKVGMIDVSTLGGIELRGPDAAEFMNRLYTFGFMKQPVGKTRYAVMTSQQGVVIDDGVSARLGDDHFYVTATTTGVERVYRDMLWWQAQWRLNVDIANVTSVFAAINIAGPWARKVLEAAGCSIDCSATAFPYLACREAQVAGITARLMRVGFVGELGFELHVPSLAIGALWDTLLQAGAPSGIRPFGVEAQRVLRLEKGHLIVGQDTDGMTHPGEVDLAWAIAKHKPFYVGGRSVAILMAGKQRRRLVGFTLSNNAPKPKEGHLVLRSGDIVGNVTSCEYSPTLDCIIGLAYAHPSDATPNSRLCIRTDNGVEVMARVAQLPFYDPDNQRQQL